MAGLKPLTDSHKRDLNWIQGFEGEDVVFGPGTLSNASLKALIAHGFVAPVEGREGHHRVLSAKERAANALLVAKQAADDAACAIQVALDLAFSDSAKVSVCDDIRGMQQLAWDIAEQTWNFNEWFVKQDGNWHADW